MALVEPTPEEIENMVCLDERWKKLPTGEVVRARWILYRKDGEVRKQYLGLEITPYAEVPFAKFRNDTAV